MAQTLPTKEERVLETAEGVFTRYGYARTTMGDLARSAGLSRPALYLLFPDKEAVFAGVIGAMDDRKHAELEAILADTWRRRTPTRPTCSTSASRRCSGSMPAFRRWSPG